MRTKLLAATALAGSLLLMPLMQGSAHAVSLPSMNNPQSNVTLVAHGGGGGGGGGAHFSGMGGGGAPMGHAMGGWGGHAMGGSGPHAMGGNGPHMHGGNFAENGGRNFRRGNNGEFAEHNGRAHEHFAEGDHDFDHHHGNGHRVFRNGVWVWAYGPDYYAYGDCGWLLRRAEVTGSPYWWNRYDACIGYY